MRYKVFLDTSTLIAASILLTTKAIGIEIKDVFYDEATRLMSIVKKNINKRIGVTSFAAEDEAYQVLSSAIERKLNQKISDRAKVFQLLSVAINSCESRLRDVLAVVVREPINPVEAARLLIQIVHVYDGLLTSAKKLPKPAAMLAAAVPRFLNKAEMYEVYKSQDEILNSQLTNLIYNPIEDSDKMILAHAAYLCKLYKEAEGKIEMYLASTDHHFVPIKRDGLVSRQVTDKIEETFRIIADKPGEIFTALKKEYGE